MPATEARIRTDRAGRYLTQMCSHTAQISVLAHDRHHDHREGAASAMPRRAEHTETDGVIEFDRGRCTLYATGEELVLLAEADDEQYLRLIRDAIDARLRRIGRRDRLSPTWSPGSAKPARTDRRPT